ncbi:MAG: hypothetical protein M0Q92_08010 [Methanoregula sp.]|jgi:hypothetical protein|nr:hypothetical protein [Methanoregula sp.]
MSTGTLNIWLRFEDCSLIQDCWMTDLVIKTCTGKYLVDNYPQILVDLQKRYPDLKVHEEINYEHHNRIRFGGEQTGYGPGPKQKKLNPHFEVNVPPGCYIIWTRICHGANEETNKVLVTVNCGQEVCVNLMLNSTKTCAREFLFPALARARELKINDDDLKVVARVVAKVADIEPEKLKMSVKNRLNEIAMVKADSVLIFNKDAINVIAKIK